MPPSFMVRWYECQVELSPSPTNPMPSAAATTAMTRIAVQEQLDGKTVDWMEKVSDERYHA